MPFYLLPQTLHDTEPAKFFHLYMSQPNDGAAESYGKNGISLAIEWLESLDLNMHTRFHGSCSR